MAKSRPKPPSPPDDDYDPLDKRYRVVFPPLEDAQTDGLIARLECAWHEGKLPLTCAQMGVVLLALFPDDYADDAGAAKDYARTIFREAA